MSEQGLVLQRKLNTKMQEIERVVAKALSLGEINDLDPRQRRHLEEEVEMMVESYEEAEVDGDTIEEWQARNKRIAETEIGRLMQERFEIAEQILDLREPFMLLKPR